METSLILRFRNASRGDFLAIDEHKQILQRNARVLWGWWRRQEEDERSILWQNLKPPFTAVLISTSEEVQFAVRVERVLQGCPPDLAIVPTYYHDEAKNISIWLEFSEIESVDFSRELAAKLANQTRTVFTLTEVIASKVSYESPLLLDAHSGVFVGISDIHLFDGEHNFLFPGLLPFSTKGDSTAKTLTLAKAIQADLARCDINKLDGVLVSGDIVSRGSWSHGSVQAFFQELSNCLNVKIANIFCVPGNHDFYKQDVDVTDTPLVTYEHENSYRMFRSQLFNVPPLEPLNYSASYLHKDFELRIGFLNSARWTATPNFSEYGFVRVLG